MGNFALAGPPSGISASLSHARLIPVRVPRAKPVYSFYQRLKSWNSIPTNCATRSFLPPKSRPKCPNESQSIDRSCSQVPRNWAIKISTERPSDRPRCANHVLNMRRGGQQQAGSRLAYLSGGRAGRLPLGHVVITVAWGVDPTERGREGGMFHPTE